MMMMMEMALCFGESLSSSSSLSWLLFCAAAAVSTPSNVLLPMTVPKRYMTTTLMLMPNSLSLSVVLVFVVVV